MSDPSVHLPARHGADWSEDDKLTLQMMIGHGDSIERIAEILKRTPEAIRYRLELLDSPLEQVRRDRARGQRKTWGDFPRWEQPSRTFVNRYTNRCSVCGEQIPIGGDAHFVASDRIAHHDCF